MRFGSVCSGIEAASSAWHPLGWQAAWFSEIEKFPCAVLAHHYPNIPNRGDMTKFEEWPDEPIDLLVGGTPCQSFSVAGLRKGLTDPRGNLMLTYGAIAARYRPKWLVWENVPGVLSSNGGKDFASFLDMLEALGYVCDIEILDAQFHGVAQRRRRVFVCGQHIDHILKTKTDSSALTIAQCLVEILHGILAVALSQSASGQQSSASVRLSKDGVQRRMKLFGLLGEADSLQMLQENLGAAFRRYQPAQKCSDAPRGEQEKEPTQGDQLTGLKTVGLFTLTEQSLNESLEDAFRVMKSFTTSTLTNQTTAHQIFTCSRAALLIAKLIARLNPSSPCFWSAASSALMSLKEFTNYARQTTSDLFGDLERFHAWGHFIGQADGMCELVGNIGVRNFGSVFPVSESLSGHPAPRREAAEGTAKCLTRGVGPRFDPETAPPPVAFGWQNSASQGDSASSDVTPMLDKSKTPAVAFGGDIARTLSARHDSSPCADRGMDVVAVAGTMKANNGGGGWSNSADHAAAGYMQTDGTAVRRLTPRECERLQGFPDDYTLIPHRGKPAADGPRYKALGNSMAVPVMRWIGERIQLVEALTAEAAA